VKVLFLDESGDHNLSEIDPQYPLFVLGGVIVDQDDAEGELSEELVAFKQALFGRTDIVLHTADITRNKNGFEKLKDAAFRKQFYHELNALMQRLRYCVVACAIRKNEHLSQYGVAAHNPQSRASRWAFVASAMFDARCRHYWRRRGARCSLPCSRQMPPPPV
jgi:hypothetical protein